MAILSELAVRIPSAAGLKQFNAELDKTIVRTTALEKGQAGSARATRSSNAETKAAVASQSSLQKQVATTDAVVGRFNRSTRNTASNLRDVAVLSSFLGLGGLIALSRGFKAVSAASVEFEKSIALISTLIEGTPAQIMALTEASLEFGRTFSASASQQASALYNIYSAGVTNATQATLLLTSANRLATGGAASLDAAVSVLTATLNSYSQFGYTASQISDLFFVGIVNGVTTLDKLSSALSNVTSTAANFGVTFESIIAANSAITAAGTPQAQATTQINALILSLQRATPEIRAYARELGIASLAPENFNDIIVQLARALRSSSSQTERTTKLFRLFGTEVRALRAAASLTGGGFEIFNRTLIQAANATGATDDAYGKLEKTLSERLEIAQSKFNESMIAFGDILNVAIIPGLELFASTLQLITNNLDVIGIALTSFATIQLSRVAIGLLSVDGRVKLLNSRLLLFLKNLALAPIAITALTTALVVGASVAFVKYRDSIAEVGNTLQQTLDVRKELTDAIREGSRAEVEAARATTQETIRAREAELAQIQRRLNSFGISAIERGDRIDPTGSIPQPVESSNRNVIIGIGEEVANVTSETRSLELQAKAVRQEIQILRDGVSSIRYNPLFIFDTENIAKSIQTAINGVVEFSEGARTSFLNLTPAQKFTLELQEQNKLLDEQLAKIPSLTTLANLPDGSIVYTPQELAEFEKQREEINTARVTLNMEGNAAIYRANKDARERETEEIRKELERRAQAEIQLVKDTIDDAEREERRRRERLGNIQNSLSSTADIIENGATVDNVQNTLQEAFASDGLASSLFGANSPFVNAISSTIPALGAVVGALQLFRAIIGRRTVTGGGITGSASSVGEVTGSSFETTRTTGLRGLLQFLRTGSRNARTESALEFDQEYNLRQGIDTVRTRLSEYVELLGGDTSRQIAFAGNDIKGAIQNFGDNFAGLVSGIEGFQSAGESLQQTLVRIVTALKDTNSGLQDAGLTEFTRGGTLLAGGLAANPLRGLGSVRGLRSEEELQEIARTNFREAINGTAGAPNGGFNQSVIDSISSDRVAFLNYIDRQGRELDYRTSVLNTHLAQIQDPRNREALIARSAQDVAAFQRIVDLADDFRILNPDSSTAEEAQRLRRSAGDANALSANRFETEAGFNIAQEQTNNLLRAEESALRREKLLDRILGAIEFGDQRIVNAIKIPTPTQRRAMEGTPR